MCFLFSFCSFFICGDKHVLINLHVGAAIFCHFFIWIFFLLLAFLVVSCDKGKMSLKDENGVISLDDLLDDKIAGQGCHGLAEVRQGCIQKSDVHKGNPISMHPSFLFSALLSLIEFCCHKMCTVLFFGLHIGIPDYLTPAMIPTPPTKLDDSVTPKTRLRTVRLIHPSKALLPPFSYITTSKNEESLYQKVIIHTRDQVKSRIKEYIFFLIHFFFLSRIMSPFLNFHIIFPCFW